MTRTRLIEAPLIDLALMSPDTERMRCPRCHTLSQRAPSKCAHCGFHLGDLTGKLNDAPQRKDTLVDQADILSASAQSKIRDRLTSFTRGSGHDAVVVTVTTTAPLGPSEFAFGLFEQWRVGGTQKDGVMLLLALDEAQLECVLGPALQPVLPPEHADGILARYAGPHLERGAIDSGLFNALDVIARVFEHAEGLR